ncbi:MAG TPA: hypothetical protein VHU62_06835 [Mycobacterium sp.]|jgi:hypothetical protein|nr:hypothetical protein [Mycobacterium sp.]
MAPKLTKPATLTVLSIATFVALGGIAAQATASADPDLPYGPTTCKQGYVWRGAISWDHVCVTPQVHDQTAEENRLADQRRDTTGFNGPFANYPCKQGFVWREAYIQDWVCVTPESRQQARDDNAAADSRWVVPPPPPVIN